MAYNGWKNYETWNVALWIDNEPGSYHERCEMAQQAYDDNLDDLDSAKSDLAKRLEEWVDEMKPDLGASMFSDLLGAALSEVDWYEIAENFLDDVEKPEQEAEEEEEEKEPTE